MGKPAGHRLHHRRGHPDGGQRHGPPDRHGNGTTTILAGARNPLDALDDVRELRSLPKSYRSGKLPTDQQLFSGPLNTEENWNTVAASV